MNTFPTQAAVKTAWALLSGLLPRSPLLPFNGVARSDGLLLKAESLMPTGSFKIRGATYCIARLDAQRRARGVVAYSTGNHAQAVAKAAHDAGVAATLVMSPDVPAAKLEATRRYGAHVVMAPPSSHERRALAEQLASQRGATLIPPYDHADVVAGQGSIGMELLEQLRGRPPAAVYVPVGGGGLIGGIALAIKSVHPATRVIGVEPAPEDDACRSFASGTLVSATSASDSLADAIKVQSLGQLNFELMRRHVDAMVTVTETAIAQAVLDGFVANRLVIEPAGAVALAAAREHDRRDDPPGLSGGPVVAIVSGGNTTLASLQRLQDIVSSC